jgi:hypothetical protein
MLKYLRIAVTALCLTACVLLVALWVRSYRWNDIAQNLPRHAPRTFTLVSMRGRLTLFISMPNPLAPPNASYLPSRWYVHTNPVTSSTSRSGVARRAMWDYSSNKEGEYLFAVPHWSPVVLFGAMATSFWLPCFKWRFSLRTLLITTALIAVGLGIIAMSS